jgi:hypothetical protein
MAQHDRRYRSDSFTFRVSREERTLITMLATRWQRTESDTVRRLVRMAAHSLGLSTHEAEAILSERNDEHGRTQ